MWVLHFIVTNRASHGVGYFDPSVVAAIPSLPHLFPPDFNDLDESLEIEHGLLVDDVIHQLCLHPMTSSEVLSAIPPQPRRSLATKTLVGEEQKYSLRPEVLVRRFDLFYPSYRLEVATQAKETVVTTLTQARKVNSTLFPVGFPIPPPPPCPRRRFVDHLNAPILRLLRCPTFIRLLRQLLDIGIKYGSQQSRWSDTLLELVLHLIIIALYEDFVAFVETGERPFLKAVCLVPEESESAEELEHLAEPRHWERPDHSASTNYSEQVLKEMEARKASVMTFVAEMHSCSWNPTGVDDVTKWLEETLEDRLTEAIAAINAEKAAAATATEVEVSEALCAQMCDGQLGEVILLVIRVIHFIVPRALNYRQFTTLLDEVGNNYHGLLLHSNGIEHPELAETEWLLMFYFLVDMTAHLNRLNFRMQGNGNTVLSLQQAMYALEKKLGPLITDFETDRLLHSEKRRAYKDACTVSGPQQNFDLHQLVGFIPCLLQSFKTRFGEFRAHTHLFSFITHPSECLLNTADLSYIPNVSVRHSEEEEVADLKASNMCMNKLKSLSVDIGRI
ncbi:unnamed protein product [Dibothriocephalus latus]|uniref:Uncharacterized protein n=1 Tax=Dibothriocephalus latus TaxID=60516 RepID=A0A3P7LDS7_DIBLA|nr:unnamed protein product [Dibothriocephalus latus]